MDSVRTTDVLMFQSEVPSCSRSMLHRGVLAFLCIAEILTLGAIATLYRAFEKPDMVSYLESRPGILFLCLVAGIVVSLTAVVSRSLTIRKHDPGLIRRTVAVNLIA